MPQSRWAAALALSAVMVVSMALGGGAVAATYEARLGEQRDALLTAVQQRHALAQERLELTKRQLQETQQRVEIGTAPQEAALDMRAKVREAEAALQSTALDIEEIRATGREPMQSLSAPLVSGRDFVTERLRVEMTTPMAALDAEKARAAAVRSRIEVGVAQPNELDDATTRIAELQAAVQALERKLAIRQTFLKGGVPNAVAELRGLEAENESWRLALRQRIESARRRVQYLQQRVEVGTAHPVELGEARLRLQELELEMSKAEYDLLLIRKQLAK